MRSFRLTSTFLCEFPTTVMMHCNKQQISWAGCVDLLHSISLRIQHPCLKLSKNSNKNPGFFQHDNFANKIFSRQIEWRSRPRPIISRPHKCSEWTHFFWWKTGHSMTESAGLIFYPVSFVEFVKSIIYEIKMTCTDLYLRLSFFCSWLKMWERIIDPILEKIASTNWKIIDVFFIFEAKVFFFFITETNYKN